MKHKAIAILTLAFVLGVCPQMINAQEQKGSITANYETPNTLFSLYLVGTEENVNNWELLEPYNSYGVDESDEYIASTLVEYIHMNEVAPDRTEVSDQDGTVVFEDLEKGIYLLEGASAHLEECTLTPVAALILIPGTGEEPVWDVVITGKCDKEELDKVTVRKIWKQDLEEKRPESIIVQLLRDGKPALEFEDNEVILNSENGWSYTWSGLEKNSSWSAVEKEVPAGYKVSITRFDGEIQIVNTADTPTPPDKPHKPGKPNKPGKPGRLPQTGQLWWPIPMLICAGLLCMIIGVLLKKKDPEA